MPNQRSFPRRPHQDYNVVPGSHHAPLPFLRPTAATFLHAAAPHTPLPWSSRHQRKARHHAIAPPSGAKRVAPTLGESLLRMSVVEYWNISWWIAISFTVGSVVWVVNGFIVFLPALHSEITVDLVAAGWTAWAGATIFSAASLLLIWEAWNRGETAYFGWGLDQALHHKFHYATSKEKSHRIIDEIDTPVTKDTAGTEPARYRPKHWIWWTTDTKYWRELGFLAGFVQLCAATIFWISGFTGLPQIHNHISQHQGLIDGVYWAPQVIGGCGFIISSLLYMLETQKKWYIPAIQELGWHIGFWNFVGAIGFTLCGAFGFSSASWAVYQSSLSTFWGGWAFLIGSTIQWYEAVNAVQR